MPMRVSVAELEKLAVEAFGPAAKVRVVAVPSGVEVYNRFSEKTLLAARVGGLNANKEVTKAALEAAKAARG